MERELGICSSTGARLQGVPLCGSRGWLEKKMVGDNSDHMLDGFDITNAEQFVKTKTSPQPSPKELVYAHKS